MRYPKLRELKEAIRALASRPYTNKFPYKPHIPYEAFRGRPEFNDKYCIGCTACVQVCPARAIKFEDKLEEGSAKRVLTVRWDLCVFCGQCQANCPPEKGIVLSREFDLATTEKRGALRQTIEKDLKLCEHCGGIVAPRGQILWVADKLGPLAFSNTSLILSFLRKLNLAQKESPSAEEKKEIQRPDRIKVLCPACRREAVIKS